MNMLSAQQIYKRLSYDTMTGSIPSTTYTTPHNPPSISLIYMITNTAKQYWLVTSMDTHHYGDNSITTRREKPLKISVSQLIL